MWILSILSTKWIKWTEDKKAKCQQLQHECAYNFPFLALSQKELPIKSPKTKNKMCYLVKFWTSWGQVRQYSDYPQVTGAQIFFSPLPLQTGSGGPNTLLSNGSYRIFPWENVTLWTLFYLVPPSQRDAYTQRQLYLTFTTFWTIFQLHKLWSEKITQPKL
jgi:hypothetical protein